MSPSTAQPCEPVRTLWDHCDVSPSPTILLRNAQKQENFPVIRFHPPQDLHKSGYVARVFGLRDVVLAELSAHREMAFGEAMSDAASKAQVRIEDDASADLCQDGQSLIVQVHFSVTVSQGEEGILAVNGRFDLQYHRQVEDAEITNGDIQLFAKINGVYNCWPYIREVVSSTFARLGYPPFTLDSLVIAPQPESSEAPAEA